MKGDLELYRVFYVVAKNLHMSKASEELFISQPAVSQSIKKLESQINTILFIRSNKGLKLTEEGKMLYKYIGPAINMITSAENELTNYKELNRGKIKIGISTTLSKLVLTSALEKFHIDYPNIDIDITNDLTSSLIDRLNSGILDIVILNEGLEIPENMDSKVLKEIEHCFVASYKRYPDLKNKTMSINDLNLYPLILQKNESNTRQFLNSFALDNKVILKPYMEVVSAELVVLFSTVCLGIGFAIKDFVKDEMLENKLFEIPIKENIPLSNIWLVTNKNIMQSAASKKFVSYLKEDE